MENIKIKMRSGNIVMTLVTLILFFASSCSSQDPSIRDLESYRFYKSGDNQSGYAGQYLQDSLAISFNGRVLNLDSNAYKIPTEIRVHFEVISGGGSIDQPNQVIPASGLVSTKWKIGTSSTNQIVTASLYDKTGKLLAKMDFTAFAFQPGRWDIISNFPVGYLNDMVRDTINAKTFMIVGSKLYEEGDNYFQWKEVQNVNNINFHSIEIDKKGTLYVGAWDGNLFKSDDHGKTFSECTKPIPNYNGYFELIVNTDNTIWVSRWTYPLRYSNDGGQTWKITESGLNNSSQAMDVFKFSNGNFITWMGDNYSVLESSNGINWLPISTLPKFTSKIYVTEKDEIIAINQESGMSIYKLANGSQVFTRVYSLMASYNTAPMKDVFNKINGYYYICIPGAGILKTINFNSFELVYDNSDIRGLMIDHNGVFFVTNKDFNKVYCYKEK